MNLEENYWSTKTQAEIALLEQKLRLIDTELDFSIIRLTGAKVTQDGNQYCCLYGDNLHDGIAGYGDTPYKAVLAFNNEWNKSPITIKEK